MRTHEPDGTTFRLLDTDGLAGLQQAVKERFPLPEIGRFRRMRRNARFPKPELIF
jgi:hypothetical protein